VGPTKLGDTFSPTVHTKEPTGAPPSSPTTAAPTAALTAAPTYGDKTLFTISFTSCISVDASDADGRAFSDERSAIAEELGVPAEDLNFVPVPCASGRHDGMPSLRAQTRQATRTGKVLQTNLGGFTGKVREEQSIIPLSAAKVENIGQLVQKSALLA
jgi:hypothetical protein